jgi:hypothetical protein
MPSNNPADRLLNIFERARACDTNQSLRLVWATVFGLESSNIGGIFYHLVLIEQLMQDTELQIRKIPNLDYNLYLAGLPNIRSIIGQPNLERPLREYYSNIGDLTLTSLRFCAERLRLLSPEPDISQSDIDSLKNDLDDLVASLEHSTLTRELKLFIYDILESARRALMEYSFRGITGLRQELFCIFERLQRHFPEFEVEKDKKEVKDFWGIIAQIDSLTSVALNVPSLLSNAACLLPALPAVINSVTK